MKNININTPSIAEVEFYLKKWDANDKYTAQESALYKLFHQTYTSNENIADVLIKANAVNGFYSTNIYDIYSVADCIVKADIDEKLKLGSVEAVDAIRYININGKIRNCYSFATKYCSHHNAEDFPIFDSYVEHVLMHLNKIDKFYDKKSLDLHNYGDFKFVLLLFKNFYKLNDYTLKQIDQYLWQLGKEYFPNKY